MNEKLLLSLADAIESDQVPEEQFNMRIWGKENGIFCGCAIGWGIKLGILKDVKLIENLLPPHNKLLSYKLDELLISYEITAKIFNITYDDACYLFHPAKYYNSTKQTVVDRIREFVKGEINSIPFDKKNCC